MQKKFFFVSLFLFIFLSSGCIKIAIDQKISPSGLLETKAVVDFSQIAQGSAGGLNPSAPNSATACDSQKQQFEKKGFLVSFGCRLENSVIYITAAEQLPESIFKKEESFFSTKYSFDLGKYQEVSEAAQGFAGTANLPSLPVDLNQLTADQIARLKLVGFDANYSLQMPGLISSSNFGKIQNNKVVISLEDFGELSDKSVSKIIESTEFGLLWLVAIGVVLFLVLVGCALLLYFFVLKKKQPAAGPDFQNMQSQKENVFYPNQAQMPPVQQPRQPFSQSSRPLNQQPIASDGLQQISQVPKPLLQQQPLQKLESQFGWKGNAGMQAESSPKQPLKPQPAANQGQFVSQKPKLPPEQPVFVPRQLQPLSGLSVEEESDAKSLVAVLAPEKQNYSSDQIMLVVLEKGYSKKVAGEVIRRIYG